MGNKHQSTWLAAALVTMLACSKGGDSRESSTGGLVQSPPGATGTGTDTGGTTAGSTAGGTTSGSTAGGTTSGDSSGGTTSGSTAGTVGIGSTDVGVSNNSLSGSLTLEQCQAKVPAQAWRAVVNGGQSPTDCVETLVPWCCSRAEIERQFPSMTATIETGNSGKNFSQFIDTDHHVLYACSTDGGSPARYTFHMAKVVTSTGTTSYKTLFITQLFPAFPNDVRDAATCPNVTTSQLNSASLLDAPGPSVDSDEHAEVESPPVPR